MFGLLFVEALHAPRRDPQWAAKCVVGGVLNLGMALLTLVPVLLAVMPETWPLAGKVLLAVGAVAVGLVLVWVMGGYLYRVFVDALNGVEGPYLPHWREWRRYFFAGIYMFLIVLGYLFLMVVGLSALISVLGLMPVGEDPGKLSTLLMLMMVTVILLYRFLPIAFARFAAEGRVWAAFDPGAIWADVRRAVDRRYAQACIAFAGLWLLGNILGGLPYIGLPLGSVYMFYVMVVFARIFGKLIGDAERAAQVQPPRDP